MVELFDKYSNMAPDPPNWWVRETIRMIKEGRSTDG